MRRLRLVRVSVVLALNVFGCGNSNAAPHGGTGTDGAVLESGVAKGRVDGGPRASPNRAPTPADDYAATRVGQSVTIAVLSNDSDPDGDALAILSTSVSKPAHGTAASQYGGTILYTPDPGFVGIDTFTYTVVDGFGATAKANVTVTVGG